MLPICGWCRGLAISPHVAHPVIVHVDRQALELRGSELSPRGKPICRQDLRELYSVFNLHQISMFCGPHSSNLPVVVNNQDVRKIGKQRTQIHPRFPGRTIRDVAARYGEFGVTPETSRQKNLTMLYSLALCCVDLHCGPLGRMVW
jgi:hypothetical protein